MYVGRYLIKTRPMDAYRAWFCLPIDVSSPVFGFTGWGHIYPEFFGQAQRREMDRVLFPAKWAPYETEPFTLKVKIDGLPIPKGG